MRHLNPHPKPTDDRWSHKDGLEDRALRVERESRDQSRRLGVAGSTPGLGIAERNSTTGSFRRSLAVALIASLVLVGCGPRNAAQAPEVPATARTSDPGAALQEIIDLARIERGARGALAVIASDGQVWRLASGTADDEGSPVSTDMRFRIGSITKPIISALALDQVDRGTLTLDLDITGIVGPPLRTAPRVSLRNLLNHTSGLFDIGNEGDPIADIENLTDPELIDEARELIASASAGQQEIVSDRLAIGLAETHDRYFEPGTGFHYSNTNYQIVGVALREATGRPLDDLLRERITGPLGLTDTSLAPADRSTPEFHGYATEIETGEQIDVTNNLLAFGNGASGGILSTADELLEIVAELVHGSLLSDELTIEMRTPSLQSGGTYGLGLATYQLACGRFYGHEGRVNGTTSIALVDADRADRAIAAAFNSTDHGAGLVEFAESLLCHSSDADPAPTTPHA